MKRTDKLNISIRPELKAGFKKLYEDQLLSNAFEYLVWDEINGRIRDLKNDLEGQKEAYSVLANEKEKKVSDVFLLNLEKQIQSFEERYEELLELREKSFPEGFQFTSLKEDSDYEVQLGLWAKNA